MLDIQNYIDTDKIYLKSRKIRTLLVQGIHQENDPKGRIQNMKDSSFSTT